MNTTNIPRYKASSTLQTQFISNNDHVGDCLFTQLKRVGNVAIYRRDKVENGKNIGFEVIIINTIKAGTTFFKGGTPTTNSTESYPGAASFGKIAWNCANLNLAELKFASVVKSMNDKALTPSVSEDLSEDVPVTPKTVSPVVSPKSHLSVTVPTGEFTQAQFAVVNGMPERGSVYNVIKNLLNNGTLKESRRVQYGKGRPTCLYVGV